MYALDQTRCDSHVGTAAVRTFRRLGAALENRDESDDEGPLFLSALIDGSIVQMLDGDSGEHDEGPPARQTASSHTSCLDRWGAA